MSIDVASIVSDIQEAAAEAALAERDRYLEEAAKDDRNPMTDGYGEPDSQEIHDAEIAHGDSAPYPADPYSMDSIQNVESSFSWMEGRDVEEVTSKRESFEGSKRSFHLMRETIGTIRTEVTNYMEGQTVTTFAGKYLDKVTQSHKVQEALLNELSKMLTASEGMLVRLEKDANETKEQTVSALNDIRDDDNGDATLALAVLGIVISGVSAAVSGGSITFALAAGSTNLLSSAADGPSEDKKISGETVDDVLSSMSEVLSDHREKFESREDELVAGLHSDSQAIRSHIAKLGPVSPQMSHGYGGLNLDGTLPEHSQ